jgi:hypothetical protein
MTEPKTDLPSQSPDGEERWKQAAARLQGSNDSSNGYAMTHQAKLESDPSKSSYAGYLFGSSGTLDRPAWSDSAQGRAAIRVISRGIFGAAAFAYGGYVARTQLRNYDVSKFSWKEAPAKPLQAIAYLIDKGPGRLISEGAGLVATLTGHERSAVEQAKRAAVNFRNKAYFHDTPGMEHGRSLGAEVVSITYDFFLASIGDALARNTIQAFDPNLKQPWFVDDQGHATTRDKGRFDVGNWARAVGRASWRIVSKNAGEDWAAALPYVYQMKWQRQAISKINVKLPGGRVLSGEGFKLWSDQNLNGAGSLIDREGNVTRNYHWQGALDLHCRFVGYNWYTLMYREGYDTVGRMLKRWSDNGYKIEMPHLPKNPVVSAIDSLGFGARYVTKSFIKANMYMQPAVVPFWLFRVPQTQRRAGYALEEHALGNEHGTQNAYVTTQASRPGVRNARNEVEFGYSTLHGSAEGSSGVVQLNGRSLPDTLYAGDKAIHKPAGAEHNPNSIWGRDHPFEKDIARGPLASVMNGFGALCFHSGNHFSNFVNDMVGAGRTTGVDRLLFGKNLSNSELLRERNDFMRSAVDASFAYTPYMWAKAETALRVDDRRSSESLGQMDKAIYRFIDSGLSLNLGGMGKSFGQMLKLGVNLEKDVKSREGGAAALDRGTSGVGDGSTIPRAEDRPLKTVEANSVKHVKHDTKHDPVDLSREDRSWAEQVTGRNLAAQFQSQATLQ